MFHRYDDVIGGGSNGSPEGGFNRDADIYGNFFINANDDAIELDGGQSNVRLYNNRMTMTYCGVSAAPCIVGPSYIFRNVFHDGGDSEFSHSVMLKNHFGDIGCGRIFYVGNTGYGIGAYPQVKHSNANEVRLVTRNNVLPETIPAILPAGDLDYDLYYIENPLARKIFGALANGRGFEKMAWRPLSGLNRPPTVTIVWSPAAMEPDAQSHCPTCGRTIERPRAHGHWEKIPGTCQSARYRSD